MSWLKKFSGVPTATTEDAMREVILPQGFVDIKVCSVAEVRHGLKLVLCRERWLTDLTK
jgi:hypothetical protein